jgi:hypothetical protein
VVKQEYSQSQDLINLPTATFRKLKNDVILVKYKQRDEEFSLEDAKRHTEAVHRLDGGKPKHIILDFRGVDVQFSNEARDYFAAGSKHSPLRKSQSIVINSLAHKIVANFYMKFNKPDCPVRIFETPAEAEAWIKTLN